MQISLHFYSYFKELAGCAETTCDLPEGSTIRDLLDSVNRRFPRLAAMQNSMLIAVDVEYQRHDYVLKPGDAVSLFPPVQGG